MKALLHKGKGNSSLSQLNQPPRRVFYVENYFLDTRTHVLHDPSWTHGSICLYGWGSSKRKARVHTSSTPTYKRNWSSWRRSLAAPLKRSRLKWSL